MSMDKAVVRSAYSPLRFLFDILGGWRSSRSERNWPTEEPTTTVGFPIGIIVLSTLVVIVLWTALIFDSKRLMDGAVAQAGRDSGNLVTAFKEHIRRTAGAIDQLLVAIAAEHEASPDEFRIPNWAAASPLLKDMGFQVSLIGPEGISRYSSLDPNGRVDLKDRPHFRYHLDPAAPQPYISVPVLGRVSNKWSIQFTRRLTRDGGTFDGVIVISVDPFYFSQFFDSVNLGEQGAAALIGRDGVVRARRGLNADDIGQDVRGARLLQELDRFPSGTYESRSPIDGIDRIIAYTEVPDYPLVVTIGFGLDEVLARPRRERTTQFIAGGILTAIIVVLTWFLVRETRRRQEAEIKRRQDSFRALFEGNPVPMWLADVETLKFVAVNDAAVAHYGYSRDQFLGMSVLDIRPPEDRDMVRERFKSQKSHSGNDRTWRHVKADGSVIEVSVYRRVMQYQGRQTSLVGVIDVTERRLAEKERDRNRELLDRIVDAVPVTIAVKDAQTLRYVWLNQAGEKLMGVPRADMIGKGPHDLFGKETADLVVAHDRELLKSKTAMSVAEHTIQTPSKGRRLVTARRIPICDKDGDPKYLIGVLEDVTDRKAMEDQLRQSQKMEAVGNLSGGIAHDFNNLLTIIIGNLDLLQSEVAGNAEATQRVETILQASERGADLTRQMLAFSRRQPLQPKSVDINGLVEETIRLLHRTLGEEITVNVRLGSDLGTVLTDPQQFGTALVNIAINARDAMPSGGTLTVATRAVELDAAYTSTHPEVRPGMYACVEVSDTGAGMSRDVLERVFEPFFTTKPTGKGTGLGLSMVYGFIKQSDGHINVYSEVGHGTTFKLYFPSQQNDVASRSRSKGDMTAMRGGGETILVVDDNSEVRATVVLQLKQLGYLVHEADNASAALIILDGSATIDLLLTDVIMPGGMNGKELGTEACRRHSMLKVLFTSGFPGTSLTGTRFDEDDILLSKPYRSADLARAVRKALDRRPASELSPA